MGCLLLRLLLAACRSSRCSCMNWRMPSSGVRACVRVRVTVRALPLLTREPQRPGRRPQHDADADHCPGHSRQLSSRTQAFLAPCFARGLHPRPRTNPAARNGGRGHSGGGAAVVRHSRHAGRASAARAVAQGAGHLSSSVAIDSEGDAYSSKLGRSSRLSSRLLSVGGFCGLNAEPCTRTRMHEGTAALQAPCLHYQSPGARCQVPGAQGYRYLQPGTDSGWHGVQNSVNSIPPRALLSCAFLSCVLFFSPLSVPLLSPLRQAAVQLSPLFAPRLVQGHCSMLFLPPPSLPCSCFARAAAAAAT